MNQIFVVVYCVHSAWVWTVLLQSEPARVEAPVLIQIETKTNVVRCVPHLFKASWRRCPHFPSNMTGAWSNHSAKMCNNLSWGWYVFYVIFERFYPRWSHHFPVAAARQKLGIKTNRYMSPNGRKDSVHEGDLTFCWKWQEHDLTILSNCVIIRPHVVPCGIYSTEFSWVVKGTKTYLKFKPLLWKRVNDHVMKKVRANPYVPWGLRQCWTQW